MQGSSLLICIMFIYLIHVRELHCFVFSISEHEAGTWRLVPDKNLEHTEWSISHLTLARRGTKKGFRK